VPVGPTELAGVAPAGRTRTALWIGAVVILIGAGAAIAILLAHRSDSSRTTVLVDRAGKTTTVTTKAEAGEPEATREADVTRDSEVTRETEPSTSATVDAGTYVQAGSFRTVSHVEQERRRLAAAGIDVSVISSDGAAELYPGFQVLIGGPFDSSAQEESLIEALKENGVSAFARDLSPASLLNGAGDADGHWAGTLDRTSGERPKLEGPVPATVEIDSAGETGTLETEGCSEALTLIEEGPQTLTYSQDSPCIAGGKVFVRPIGGELMLAMLPLGTDVFVTGTLSPG
jgi:hypothetical protein